MKRILLVVTVVLLALPLVAAEPKKSAIDEMMSAQIEAAKLVPEHRRLEELVGDWSVTTKLWADPSQPPSTATGKATNTMILGGRFLSSDSRTSVGGLATDSLTIFGFDRRTNDYTLVGYDTLGTYYITAAGKFDAAKRAIVLDGSYAQPPEGKEQPYRFEWSASKDRHVFTLYFFIDGKPVRVAETTYAR